MTGSKEKKRKKKERHRTAENHRESQRQQPRALSLFQSRSSSPMPCVERTAEINSQSGLFYFVSHRSPEENMTRGKGKKIPLTPPHLPLPLPLPPPLTQEEVLEYPPLACFPFPFSNNPSITLRFRSSRFQLCLLCGCGWEISVSTSPSRSNSCRGNWIESEPMLEFVGELAEGWCVGWRWWWW